MRRKRYPTLLALAAFAFLLAPANSRAQQGSAHTLEGRVMLPNGVQPTNPVRVTLTYSGRHIYDIFTDLGGHFSFTALSNGRYQLTAEGDGQTFETTTIYAEVIGFGQSPQTFTQNIQLLPVRGKAITRAGVVSIEELDKDVPTRARESYQKGLKSADDNKPEQAVKFFNEAIASYAPFYAANMQLAEQLSKLQRYEESLTAYRKASELKPERADPYVGVGVTLVSLKRYEEGIRMLRRIVELDDKLAAPYLSLGYAEMSTGDNRAAETHLLRALELTKSSMAHVYLANVYEQLGDPAKAVEHLRAYLKENPQTPNAASINTAIEKLRKKSKKG
jgi:Tfp pilus assembly protein PilF